MEEELPTCKGLLQKGCIRDLEGFRVALKGSIRVVKGICMGLGFRVPLTGPI